MRKVLITGGAGFIGSHLAEAVLSAGDAVVAVDDLSTGSYRNVDHLSGDAFELVVASVDDPATMEGLVRTADLVYHLAAAVGVKLIVADPVRTIETNIRGTEVVLRLANKWRRPVVVASTSEVYGKSERVPYAEEHDMVLGPTSHSRWAYAASKAIDEFLAVAYFRRDGLPVVIARLFNTVGPRQTGRYGMVLPTFVRQALRGEPITVYGDGRQSRAFTYVGDAVARPAGSAPAPGGVRRGVQRGRRPGGHHPRPGPPGAGAHRVGVRDRDGALRPGLRAGLRGHGAPGARHLQAAAGHRVRPPGEPGGDHRPGGRALPAEPGLRLMLAGLLAFVLAAGLAGACVRFPVLGRPFTRAASGARWRADAVPLAGGVAMAAAFAAAVAAFGRDLPGAGAVLAGAGTALAVGLADDLRPLPAWAKLAGQAGAGAVLAALGVRAALPGPEAVAWVATIAWVVVVANALNLFDNFDGAAGGAALVASLALALWWGIGPGPDGSGGSPGRGGGRLPGMELPPGAGLHGRCRVTLPGGRPGRPHPARRRAGRRGAARRRGRWWSWCRWCCSPCPCSTPPWWPWSGAGTTARWRWGDGTTPLIAWSLLGLGPRPVAFLLWGLAAGAAGAASLAAAGRWWFAAGGRPAGGRPGRPRHPPGAGAASTAERGRSKAGCRCRRGAAG